MALRAVFFDIDGTLYANYKSFFYMSSVLFKYPNLAVAFSAVRREIRKIDVIDDFHQTQAELLAQKLSIKTDYAKKIIEERIYGCWKKRRFYFTPLPHVKKLLRYLRENQIIIGALSDFPILDKLHYLGLADFFSVQFCSEDYGYLKPHARPFEILLESVSLTAAETLYVGNNYHYDIEGALNVGMAAAHYSPFAASKIVDDKFYRFSSYKKLHRFLNEKIDKTDKNR